MIGGSLGSPRIGKPRRSSLFASPLACLQRISLQPISCLSG
jgi:hypothetical protein